MMSEADIRAYQVTCPTCLTVATSEHPIEASAAENGDDIHLCPCGRDYTHTESWKAYRRRCWERDGARQEPSQRRAKNRKVSA